MTDAEPARVPCVACLEPILPGARICPHCLSPQRPERLRIFGRVLTWIGGITAVISLVIGAASVNELYTGWRDRSRAVDELVAASRLQLQAQDYEGGWALLDDALKLDPASQPVRDFQIPFAMAWLRNIRVPAEQKFSSVVDRLLPVLYRGAADTQKTRAADVYAHIGWANYLKYRDGNRLVDVDFPYRRALELDPGNPFAHVHLGHWLLNRRDASRSAAESIAAAREHFAAALKAGRERGYVVDIALIALLDAPYDEGDGEALRMANELRKSGDAVGAGRRAQLRDVFRPLAETFERSAAARLDYLKDYVAMAELAPLYAWLSESGAGRPGNETIERQFILGRLTEAAGDLAKARAIYQSLAATPNLNRRFDEELLQPAIKRVGR